MIHHPPKSSQIGCINHSRMSGLLLFYPHSYQIHDYGQREKSVLGYTLQQSTFFTKGDTLHDDHNAAYESAQPGAPGLQKSGCPLRHCTPRWRRAEMFQWIPNHPGQDAKCGTFLSMGLPQGEKNIRLVLNSEANVDKSADSSSQCFSLIELLGICEHDCLRLFAETLRIRTPSGPSVC